MKTHQIFKWSVYPQPRKNVNHRISLCTEKNGSWPSNSHSTGGTFCAFFKVWESSKGWSNNPLLGNFFPYFLATWMFRGTFGSGLVPYVWKKNKTPWFRADHGWLNLYGWFFGRFLYCPKMPKCRYQNAKKHFAGRSERSDRLNQKVQVATP